MLEQSYSFTLHLFTILVFRACCVQLHCILFNDETGHLSVFLLPLTSAVSFQLLLFCVLFFSSVLKCVVCVIVSCDVAYVQPHIYVLMQ